MKRSKAGRFKDSTESGKAPGAMKPGSRELLPCIYHSIVDISQKIQTYALAAFFLVLLYNSPSGLVIYWTCNQIFSLLKNVFLKLVKDRRILGALVSAAGIAVFLALLLTGKLISTKRIAFCIVLLLVCQLPLILAFRKKNPVEEQVPEEKPASRKLTIRLVLLGEIFLTILTGDELRVSTAVITASGSSYPAILCAKCGTASRIASEANSGSESVTGFDASDRLPVSSKAVRARCFFWSFIFIPRLLHLSWS